MVCSLFLSWFQAVHKDNPAFTLVFSKKNFFFFQAQNLATKANPLFIFKSLLSCFLLRGFFLHLLLSVFQSCCRRRFLFLSWEEQFFLSISSTKQWDKFIRLDSQSRSFIAKLANLTASSPFSLLIHSHYWHGKNKKNQRVAAALRHQ